MTTKEIFLKIQELERTLGEDFYDLGGGSCAMSDSINNLEALTYLKDNKPLIYNHICEAYKETSIEDLNSLVVSKDLSVNDLDHDLIFVFDKIIEDKNLFNELAEFSEDGVSYKCADWELWKIVIAILASVFNPIEDLLMEIFDKYEI